MKASELIEQLKEVDPNLEVTIDLTGPNLDPCSTVGVNASEVGFDWQHGQFVLIPSRPIDYRREKCKYCHLPDNDDFRTEMTCTDLDKHEYTLVCKFKGKTVFKHKYAVESVNGEFKLVASDL